jgi:hypothetical protein
MLWPSLTHIGLYQHFRLTYGLEIEAVFFSKMFVLNFEAIQFHMLLYYNGGCRHSENIIRTYRSVVVKSLCYKPEGRGFETR